MTQFDIILCAPKSIRDAGDAIHNQYFTIDTADLVTFYEWYAFNPNIVTYACDQDEVVGYYNVIPLTKECGALFDEQAIKEEDLTIAHLLPTEKMIQAEYVYLASIAIKDSTAYRSRQCAAALIASIANQLIHMYDLGKLKRIYANPTTFHGNRMVRKLGLKPVRSHNKPLTGNDIYAMDITPEVIANLHHFAKRYGAFVKTDPWNKAKTA